MAAHRKNFDEAVEMYDAGKSIADVALVYGTSRQSMHKVLKRRGVVFRKNLRFGQNNHFYHGGHQKDARVGSIVSSAITNGKLVQADCEECGEANRKVNGVATVHAHHDDYNKPLEVRWLCRKCHAEWHQNNEPVRRVIELPCMARSEYCAMGGRAAQARKRRERHAK